jgi:hypothetical protein
LKEESTLPPAEFMDYPIVTIDSKHYISVDNHHDARTLTELYNSNESKVTGYRAVSIDVLPDHNGFFIRLEASR